MGRGVAIALVRDFTDEVTRHVLLAGPRVRSALTSPMHPDSARRSHFSTMPPAINRKAARTPATAKSDHADIISSRTSNLPLDKTTPGSPDAHVFQKRKSRGLSIRYFFRSRCHGHFVHG